MTFVVSHSPLQPPSLSYIQIFFTSLREAVVCRKITKIRMLGKKQLLHVINVRILLCAYLKPKLIIYLQWSNQKLDYENRFWTPDFYLNSRVFQSRNYPLIVAQRRKFDVLKTKMLVLRISNFQRATIRPIVPRHKHFYYFLMHLSGPES